MRARIRRGVLVCVLIGVMGCAGWQVQQRLSVARAQVSNTVAVAQQAADDVTRGDIAALPALFTDDAIFVGGQTCFPTACLGKAAVLQELAGEIAGHVRVTYTSLAAEGNIVTGHSEIREDAVSAAGLERLVEANIIVVRDGRIAALVTALDTTDPQTQQFLAAISGPPPQSH